MGPRFRADLRGADLRGAYLSGMKLTGARLEGACLDHCDLSGADLTGSELAGTSFREADLTGAKLKLPQARIRIVAKKPETDPNDPEARRRRRMDNLERSAQALLKDRLSKQKALQEQGERTKAKNSPSPFSNVDPFNNSQD
ncbi:MAG: pentapeptide repeat-containing protein [Spirochaetales bacterium]|nr:pentapeptide repeat-containing protein [Spirochaetales bacterium]